MPVVKFKVNRILQSLNLDLDQLEELLFRLKCETETDEEGYIYIELNPDRPDMYSLEGIVRSIKGLVGKEKGFILPETTISDVKIISDHVASRPIVAGAVIKGLNLDDDKIEELMQFQEKLHDTIGRRRRKVAIGIHDFDKLPDKEIFYKEVDINESYMKPLNRDEVLSIYEVLLKTEQGRKYGKISLRDSKHPALIAGGKIISLPPVINSNITKVEPGTKNLFIDVTGTDLRSVLGVLDIITCNLAYLGGNVSKIKIFYEDKAMETPYLSVRELNADPKDLSKMIGIELKLPMIKDALERARYQVELNEQESLKVKAPPFRIDVLGTADLAEDIAIMIGYEKIGAKKNPITLRGNLLKTTLLKRKLRDILVGLGFTEIIQLTLLSLEIVKALNMEEKALVVSNPVQIEHSVIRPSLITSLLDFLRENQHKEKPIKIFEIGKVAFREDKYIIEEERVALAIMDSSISYEDIQAPLYSILRVLSLKYNIKAFDLPFFLKGRSALLSTNEAEIGWLGEINPEILEKLRVEYPIAVAEIRLSSLTKEGSYKIQSL